MASAWLSRIFLLIWSCALGLPLLFDCPMESARPRQYWPTDSPCRPRADLRSLFEGDQQEGTEHRELLKNKSCRPALSRSMNIRTNSRGAWNQRSRQLGLDSTREGKKIPKPLSRRQAPRQGSWRTPRGYEQDTWEWPGIVEIEPLDLISGQAMSDPLPPNWRHDILPIRQFFRLGFLCG